MLDGYEAGFNAGEEAERDWIREQVLMLEAGCDWRGFVRLTAVLAIVDAGAIERQQVLEREKEKT